MKPKVSAKDKAKNARLLREFGISLKEWNTILKHQKGCCAMCGRLAKCFKNGLATDHNHLSGEIRGLLCVTCNRALGKFRDSEALLMAAYLYVINPPAEEALGRKHFTAPGRIGTKVRAKRLLAMKLLIGENAGKA